MKYFQKTILFIGGKFKVEFYNSPHNSGIPHWGYAGRPGENQPVRDGATEWTQS